MTIKLRRTSQESVEINTDKLGTMLVFQQFGKHDHRITENILREYFGSEPVSIHFQLKMASIFIFEMDHDVLSNRTDRLQREKHYRCFRLQIQKIVYPYCRSLRYC